MKDGPTEGVELLFPSGGLQNIMGADPPKDIKAAFELKGKTWWFGFSSAFF